MSEAENSLAIIGCNLPLGDNMRAFLVAILALMLGACATFAGAGGQFQTEDTIVLDRQVTSFASFKQGMINIGEQNGYQWTGGSDRNRTVNLSDQPNFGQTMIGRAFSVQMAFTLRQDMRTVDIMFTSFGDSSSGASNSLRRLQEIKGLMQNHFN
ncbi:hypothetical protein [Erythrobacter sp. AP23]|uniref:hypothetical protein n=1 Tax=Erythrobacter sp. AP23 TaxID=499656 RepID=UPI0012ED5847|nr:hypothetical protein [Erythrobacter sp. AP23]